MAVATPYPGNPTGAPADVGARRREDARAGRPGHPLRGGDGGHDGGSYPRRWRTLRPRRRGGPDGRSVDSAESDPDRRTWEPGWSDFDTVVNQRRELFPEEFPEGPYGAPPQEED